MEWWGEYEGRDVVCGELFLNTTGSSCSASTRGVFHSCTPLIITRQSVHGHSNPASKLMFTLLQLPAELQAEILCFVATSKQPGQQIRDLISVASTCRAWYHAVFCNSHDHIWRTIAIALGVSPSVRLDQILYPGSSALQPRRWINVVRLNFRIKKPFPPLPPGLPPITRAQSAVPRPDSTENWRRTVELMVAGEGSQRHASYTTRHANCKDGGSAVFTVSDPEVMGGRQMLCIYDATRNRTDIVHSEPWVPSGPTPTKYPAVVGYTVDKKHDSCDIRETFANEQFRSTWECKHARVGRMVSNGNTLVATAFPSEDSGRPSDIASELMCIETNSKGSSRVLWQFDASEAWEDEDAYVRYPHIKNFHMSR